MKTTTLKYISIITIILFVIACSTKKDTFVSRNMNALSTKDNILYNGDKALDKGVKDLKSQYKDNFWEILPIERMQVAEETLGPEEKKENGDFSKAEEKANKAIQKHSMLIQGSEKNPAMDEAYLLLGKARYYDQRFVPALEAFNYVLYKSPTSDKIYEAKIWKEKTNIRLENEALAINNLRKLLKEVKISKQQFADANAILSQAYLNIGETDSAIVKLKIAKTDTKSNEEKARYNFILGQIYEGLGYKDSANIAFETVINMKRKSPRQYIIHSYVQKAQMFDYEKGDVDAFLNKYNELVADYENHNYLDVLDYEMGVFYTNLNKLNSALSYYTSSLQAKSQDNYLVASTYRNMGEIYFTKANYVFAGKYYDSTLVLLNPRSREFFAIKKKRENLEDVIKYEEIVTKDDSIIKVFKMSDQDRIAYYDEYITKLKAKEAEKLNQEKILTANAANAANNVNGEDARANANSRIDAGNMPPGIIAPPIGNISPNAFNKGVFYFYNPQQVAIGKLDFAKKWGSRQLVDNWRVSAVAKTIQNTEEETEKTDVNNPEKQKIAEANNPAYSPNFYIDQLPKKQEEIDVIAKELNFSNYQLGIIYKEKFKEYKLAATKFENLLNNNPEERLVLPSMYNLYKIYQIIDANKALAMKNEIISKYPDSRYAQILSNSNSESGELTETPKKNYEKLYKLYEDGDYRTLLTQVDLSIDQYNGDELTPKFELLKANTIGKVNGLEAYKTALNYVALTYPNSEEGKLAESTYINDIPKFEKLTFYEAKPTSWKILFKADNLESKQTKTLLEKLNKFIKDRSPSKLKLSIDIYTMTENFIVIHGISSEENAFGIVDVLKEYKDYKVTDKAYIISNDNYKIVQIKKNFEEYLKTPPTAPLPPKPIEEKPGGPNPVGPNKNNLAPTPPNQRQQMQNANPPQLSKDDVNSEDAPQSIKTPPSSNRKNNVIDVVKPIPPK